MDKKIILGVIISLLIFCGCDSENNEQDVEYKEISAEEVHEILDEDILIIDVRTKEEYVKSHIKNSMNIFVDNISMITHYNIPKDRKIIVYCNSGTKSYTAANALIALGYSNVYDMEGIEEWDYDLESNN